METKLGCDLTKSERIDIEKTGHKIKKKNNYFFENGVYLRHTAEYRPSPPLKQYTQDEILHMPNGDETDMHDGFRIGLTSDTHLPYCIAGRIGKEKTIMFLPDPSPAYSTPQEAIAWQLHGCGYITDRELDDLLAQ